VLKKVKVLVKMHMKIKVLI
jgi:hypothetical protein